LEAVWLDGGGRKKRIASGVEIGNQQAVARSFNRFPSEIGEISSLEFLRIENQMRDEREQQCESQRQATREQLLRRM